MHEPSENKESTGMDPIKNNNLPEKREVEFVEDDETTPSPEHVINIRQDIEYLNSYTMSYLDPTQNDADIYEHLHESLLTFMGNVENMMKSNKDKQIIDILDTYEYKLLLLTFLIQLGTIANLDNRVNKLNIHEDKKHEIIKQIQDSRMGILTSFRKRLMTQYESENDEKLVISYKEEMNEDEKDEDNTEELLNNVFSTIVSINKSGEPSDTTTNPIDVVLIHKCGKEIYNYEIELLPKNGYFYIAYLLISFIVSVIVSQSVTSDHKRYIHASSIIVLLMFVIIHYLLYFMQVSV